MGKTFTAESDRIHDLHTTPRNNRVKLTTPEGDWRVLYKGPGCGGVVNVAADTEEQAILEATKIVRRSIPPAISLDFKVV